MVTEIYTHNKITMGSQKGHLRVIAPLLLHMGCLGLLLGQVNTEHDGVLQITTVLIEPYVMTIGGHDNVTTSHGATYVGFIVDLLHKLADVVGFRYHLYVTPDNSFGYQRDGTWNGMIKELLTRRADVAAGPMLDTSQRREVVDFTVPFLHVHATILLHKPRPGSDIRIQRASDLLNQSELTYGTLDKGIIPRSFKRTNDTTLHYIWKNMSSFRPSTFTPSNEIGIKKARDDNYAFVIQDTIGDYMAMKKPCNLITVDKFLFRHNYALALPKNSRWLKHMNKGITMLWNMGVLDELYNKWWWDKSECEMERRSRSSSLKAAQSGGFSIVQVHFVSNSSNILGLMVILRLIICLNLFSL